MSNNIELITLSNYVSPKVIETTFQEWVTYGSNNEFYQYIIDRHKGSATNSSINNSYINMIYGKGLGAHNARQNQQEWANLQTILKKKDLFNICTDFQIFGQATPQVIKTRGKKLSSIKHVAKQHTLPNVENEDGEIERYWFSKDFGKKWEAKYVPVSYPAFGTSTEAIEIYDIRPYTVGNTYFADPSYFAALQYCEMEEEISNLNINAIKNGLSAGFLIEIMNGKNFDPKDKKKFNAKIKEHLTGSTNAGKHIISYNGTDVEIKITPFPTNDSIHKQWQFLTTEAKTQILTAHKATSTSLVGITTSTGFSSSADEMKVAREQLMQNVIVPKQNQILDALKEILVAYGINLDLYFIPLVEETVEPTELNSHVCMSDEAHDIELCDILDKYALDSPDGYELSTVEEYEVGLSANQTSEQDTKLWKTRYAYVEGTSKSSLGKKSRAFCLKMRALELSGKVFRKEDIELMSSQGVNGKFAHEGGKYDLFLYGGGVNCYHRWEKRMFKKKLDANGDPKKGGALASTFPVNVSEARRQGAKIPVNSPDVAIAEIDKPNKGSLK